MSSETHQRRVQRFEKEIKEAVASFILKDLRGEIPGLLTITRVEVPGDLRTGKVFYSILGADGQEAQVQQTLKEWAPEIQRYLSSTLRLRFVPKLTFQFDTGIEKALKVEGILNQLAEKRKIEDHDGED